jgi:eukaryotic-like serine/threonine-protein kinase
MPQVVRAAQSTDSETPFRSRASRLPPALVEKAAARLAWIALACAITTVLAYALDRWLQPENVVVAQDPTMALLGLIVVLFSAGILASQRYAFLSSAAILHLGLLFQLLVAFEIALYETSTQLPVNLQLRGASLVAVWITICGLLLPNRPWITLVAAVGSAAMWPLAYYVNQGLHGFDPVPWNRLAFYNVINFMMAGWACFLNQKMYAIELSAQRAQELGSYELLSMLGKGGMGEVWRARHRLVARDAAIKLIRSEVLSSQRGRQADMVRRRFEREARATANLRSPHTVDLYDFGVAQDGSFYYVMELLDGINLQTMVEKFGPVPASRVIYILDQVCDSLEEAHRHGLVHRDIKPTNLYLCTLGLNFDFMKVLDFGLVKNVDNRQATMMTAEGMAAGTPAYMAPEIALGHRDIDGRSDLYSLGCVAYFLLTGTVVFEEATATATGLAHVQKPVIPPSQRSEVPIPKELEDIILSLLAKKADDRPRSAQELQRRLAAVPCGKAWCREDASQWWHVNLPETAPERTSPFTDPAGVYLAVAENDQP